MLNIGACYSQLSTAGTGLGWPAIVLAAVSLSSLATNGCVCVAVGRMKSSQKGSFNWLILSITACDILAALVLMPLSVAKTYLGVWPGPWWLCDLWFYLVLSVLSVVGSHLCVLCVETCFSIQTPTWFSKLSHRGGVSPLKVCLAWITGLIIPTALMAWRENITVLEPSSPSSTDTPGTNWTSEQKEGYDVLKEGYNGTNVADPEAGRCPWMTTGILLITCFCYVLPLVISLAVYGVTWLRIQRAQKGIFVRGVRSSSSSSSAERAVKQALLEAEGSIKQNGHKASDLAHKLTTSLKRSNSSIRRSKRESSIQHRSSVLDRHPSLRYSIKRQPSAKSETTRASMRHSRKSSPNPSHSGLHGDHPGLVAKLSWNSAVSDMDHSRCASPAFMEKVPICHSIADLISTHSATEPSVPAFQSSPQQQNASYCNLYVEQNKAYNWPSSEKLSQTEVTGHTPADDEKASCTDADKDDVANQASYHNNDNIPFVDDPELPVPIILKDSSDDQPSPKHGQPLTEGTPDQCQDDWPTNEETHLNSDVDAHKDVTEGISGAEPSMTPISDVLATSAGNAQKEECDREQKVLNKSPSGLDVNISDNRMPEENRSINKNLLTTSYHYEPLSVGEQNTPPEMHRTRQRHSSQSHRTRHTIHDVRSLTVTIGLQLLVHYLTCLPLIIFLTNNIKCKWNDSLTMQQFLIVAEWTLYSGILVRPFVYIGFHLHLRKAFCAIMRCNT